MCCQEIQSKPFSGSVPFTRDKLMQSLSHAILSTVCFFGRIPQLKFESFINEKFQQLSDESIEKEHKKLPQNDNSCWCERFFFIASNWAHAIIFSIILKGKIFSATKPNAHNNHQKCMHWYQLNVFKMCRKMSFSHDKAFPFNWYEYAMRHGWIADYKLPNVNFEPDKKKNELQKNHSHHRPKKTSCFENTTNANEKCFELRRKKFQANCF